MTGVAIVGAGLRGLLTATLLPDDARVTVLEAAPRPGGAVVTEARDGWVVDGGPTALSTDDPAMLQALDRLGLRRDLVRARPLPDAVVRDGRVHLWPRSAADLARLVGLRGAARAALGGRGPAAPDETVAVRARREWGDAVLDALVEPRVVADLGGAAADLSAAAAVPGMRTWRDLLRPAPPPATLRDGLESLVRAASRRLGDRLRTASPVRALRRDGDGWTLDAATGEVRARQVVLAVPARVQDLLLRDVDPALASVCGQEPAHAVARVAVALPRRGWSPPRAGRLLIPASERRQVLAVELTSQRFPATAPDHGVLLHALAAPDAGDAALGEAVAAEIAVWLGPMPAPLWTRVWRTTVAQPVIGHAERRRAIAVRLRDLPGLHVPPSAPFVGLAARFGATTAAAVMENSTWE